MDTQQTQQIQSEEVFHCDLCDWSGKSSRGLKIHKSLAHKPKEEPAQKAAEKPKPQPTAEPVAVEVEEPEIAPTAAPVEIAEPEFTPTAEPVEVNPPPADPVAEAAPPEPELLDPKSLGVKEVYLGSMLKLQGPHYVFTDDQITGPEVAEGILARVNFRWQDEGLGQYYLRARSEGGSQQWVIAENDVLESNNVQLVSLGDKTLPSNYIPAVPAPPEKEEMPVQDGPTEEELAQKQAFLDALQKYVELRDRKLEVEKEFKQIDKQVRPVILDYLKQYGTESGENKGDNVLSASGYKVHYTFTPGADYVMKDEDRILEYLKSNCLLLGLEYRVNWKNYEKLKENGAIPASFIAQVEQPVKGNDSRKLLIEPDKNFKS